MRGDGHDWRLVPLALAAWAGAWLGTAAFRPPEGVLVACICGAGIVVWRFWQRRLHWVAVTVVVVVVAVLSAGVREWQLHHSTPATWAVEGRSGVARVRVAGDPRLLDQGNRPALVVFDATLLGLRVGEVEVATSQAIKVLSSGEPASRLADTAVGTSLELRGRLVPADPATPLALSLRVTGVGDWRETPGALDRLVNSMRSGLRDATAHSPPLQAALVPSLTVGDTSAVPDDLSEQFRTTSLSHLMAVSGANLTLMLLVVLWTARALGARGAWVRVIGVLGIGLFVVLCRGEPSVVRAAAMGLVGLAAIGAGTGRGSVRALAIAVLGLMLIDPWLSRSWGFALSVAACAGLVLLSSRWTAQLGTWLPRGLAEAAAVPLAAQLATQPLITAMSGQVSLVGVFANMAAAPFVGPATVLGLVAACLVWFPPAAAVVAWIAGWAVQPIIWVAQVGADLPAASLTWPAGPAGLVLSVGASVLLILLFHRILAHPWLVVVCACLVVGGLMVRPGPLGWPGPWQAVFCDVGQGDTTVLRASEGSAVVVDTGPAPGPAQRCLDSLGITDVPMLVLTHFHADHVEGAPALILRYRPKLILVGGLNSPAGAVKSIEAAAAAVGSRVETAQPGQVLRIGEVSWHTVSVWTPEVPAIDGPAENNASIVGLAQVAGLRVLLPGDVEPDGQRRALGRAAEAGTTLDADVLKLPHHGSPNQLEAFLAAPGAKVAVASAGLRNDYGHPSAKTLNAAHLLGMTTLRTDQQGSIAIHLEGETLGIRATGRSSGG